MSDDIRFAILGCGTAGRFHAEALGGMEDASLAAVFDTREDAASAFADEHRAGSWHTDLTELLARDDIDVVSVCTPTGFHSRNAIEAARAGKHVLVEKPVGISLEEIDLLDAEAKRAGVKLGVCLQWRTNDVLNSIKQAVDSGRLARLHMLSVCLKYYRTQEYYDLSGWRGTWRYDGGGALMNQGTHALDILLWLAGPVENVYGQTRTATHRIEAEDTAAAIVNFQSGAIATIEAATSTYPGFPVQFEIHGEKGSVVFSENKIHQWKVIGEPDQCVDSVNGDNAHGASSPTGIGREGHIRIMRDMIDAIRTGRDPIVPCSEGRKSVELVLAVYRSAGVGRPVRMTEMADTVYST